MSLARARALAVLGALVLLSGIVVIVVIFTDNQGRVGGAEGCPPGGVVAITKIPNPENIKINVYNSTQRIGLANNVASELAARSFNIVNKDKDGRILGEDPKKEAVGGTVRFRYGPKTVGAMQLLRAWFLMTGEDNPKDKTKQFMAFDIKRTDDVVDVVLGAGYQKLGSQTEVNQALAQLGEPELPKDTCAAKAE